MRDIKTQKGYTIVETLIVLAVTGVMFASTVALISGQVAKAQYRDTVFRVNQSIQNIINDVQNGVFNPTTTAPSVCPNAGGKSDCVYAGVRLKIDDTGKMTKEYLYLAGANASTPPAQATDLSATPVNEVTTLPGYVDYKPAPVPATELTFYVLFSNYSYDSANKGGVQSYTIKYASGSAFVNQNNEFLCLVNGSRKAKIVVGQNGQLESKIEFQPAGNC